MENRDFYDFKSNLSKGKDTSYPLSTIDYDHLQKQAGKADELDLSNSSTPRVMRRESSF